MVRIAIIQAGSVQFSTEATLARLEHWATEAASQGAQLVLFPEAFVGGYPKGMDFGARLGSRSESGRDDFRRYFDGAITVPGPAVERIAAVAAEHRMHLVTGVIERVGATLYCAVLHYDDLGRLVGHRRKLMPTATERIVWGMGDGSMLKVSETPLGVIGAAICWENYMPLLRMALYAQGVQIYCAPTVDDRDGWQATMRHIALEGRCYVLSAAQYLTREDFPEDYAPIENNAPGTVLIRGGSAIYGPLGEIIAEPVYGREAILTADIDLGLLPRAKYDFDAVGHYARPDIFSMTVDQRPRAAANFVGNDLPED